MLARLDRGLRVAATGMIIGLLAWHGVLYGLDQRIFSFREGERRSLAVGEYVARSMPDRAIFISMWHSGSIRYYSGRLTVRYDWILATELDSVIAELQRQGYHPYLVMESWEEAQFLKKFGGYSDLAALDWPPVALNDAGTVKIYDPADRLTRGRRNPIGIMR
jgi:hypothetical protein